MSVLQHKVVSALPVPLQPNSIYYVRSGTGFDQYVTNSSGVIVAYPANSPALDLAQTIGQSTTVAMSQKAATDALNTKANASTLGTAATRDVGTSDGQVPEFVSSGDGLGGFGYGRVGTYIGKYTDVNDVPKRTGFYLLTEGHPNSTNNKAPAAGFYDTCIMRTMRQGTNEFVDVYLPHPAYSPGMVLAPHDPSGYVAQRIVSDSVNLRTGTGNSTIYPMSQKAVTDALGTKVGLSGNQTILGVKTFLNFPVTPSAAPTADYQVANKKYVDDKSNLQPSMTGSITLNGTTDNAVGLADIVTELALEPGDVIRIDTGAYNKLHTVESITNNGSIIVNYEHAGNRGDGSLKLPDFTGQSTVTRIAKWFNAPLGLGQAWTSVKESRVAETTYTNTTGRAIAISSTLTESGTGSSRLHVDGLMLMQDGDSGKNMNFFGIIPNGSTYRVELSTGGSVNTWAELR